MDGAAMSDAGKELDRRFDRAVRCTDCGWLGKYGALILNANSPTRDSLRCPACYFARWQLVANEGPETKQ
jgi:hypothetical protein